MLSASCEVLPISAHNAFFVHRQTHPLEDAGYHLLPDKIMVMESPPYALHVALCRGLCNVVQYGSPTQPFVVRHTRYVVEHLQRMCKIVFMPMPVDRFCPVQSLKFRKYQLQQTAFSSSKKPFDGWPDRTILRNSSATRSRDTMEMRSLLRAIASNVSG